jgi:hypothetical protein
VARSPTLQRRRSASPAFRITDLHYEICARVCLSVVRWRDSMSLLLDARWVMARRQFGQVHLRFGDREGRRTSSLDILHGFIVWAEIDRYLAPIYASAKGEQAWPPQSMLKALILAV